MFELLRVSLIAILLTAAGMGITGILLSLTFVPLGVNQNAIFALSFVLGGLLGFRIALRIIG